MPAERNDSPVLGESGCDHSRSLAVIAPAIQVLTGQPVAKPTTPAICTGCAEHLGESDIVFAYASQPVDAAGWTIQRVCCWGCAPATIRSPTLGTTELLVGGRLGALSLPTSRSYRLCLTELAVRAESPPTEGAPP